MSKEPRKILCPIPEYGEVDEQGVVIASDYYVTLPPKWLGKHAIMSQAAVQSGEEKGLKGILLTFAVSLAIADDFNLPGLIGKPENWDFEELDLELISWVNFAVYSNFNRDFTVKKNYLLASLNGHVTSTTTAAEGIGNM